MGQEPSLLDWERSGSRTFSFLGRHLDAESGQVCLRYALDGIEMEEWVGLPRPSADLTPAREAALGPALDLLHWIVGISYWKAGCPAELRFEGPGPDRWQANWLNHLYRSGLAEFAHHNGLAPERWTLFQSDREQMVPSAPLARLARRTLVPMGGGKDSLVAWARLQKIGDTSDSIQIGSSELIAGIGEALPGQHWRVQRRLDPKLAQLNARGAWNGHVPVTAINSAILALAALWLDYDRVAFANERSADEVSLIDAEGRSVNHQFSKSFEFELMFDQWVRRYLASDLCVFSILRRDRELSICREFAGLDEFHPLFSSCNRNFHLDGPRTGRWCGQCPKCHFVFLGLAPFTTPARLTAIFGRDLLADIGLVEGFSSLMALDGVKPLECVGEANEARAAALALSRQPEWRDHAVVAALAGRLSGTAVPGLGELCRPHGPNLIPREWLDAA